jgi:hypothetical protein
LTLSRRHQKDSSVLFPELAATPVQFDGAVVVVEGTGVKHLRYG